MIKFAIALLALATAFPVSAGIAQEGRAQPRVAAQADGSAQMKAEMLARFAERRRDWLAAGHKSAPPPAAGTCQITAGKLLTTSFNVAKQPAAPEISVTYKGCTPGFLSVDVYFYSASAPNQSLHTTYNVGTFDAPTGKQGTVVFKQVGGQYGYASFNPYSAAGSWTLREIYIADRTGSYTDYNQAALTPLFNTLTLTVTNHGTPDTAAPLITSGKILTPKVSISSHPFFFVNLDVSDDISGLAYAYASVRGPGGTAGAFYVTFLPAPVKNTTVKVYDYLGNQTATGTWTIYALDVCDIAHNCTYVSNASDIQALLGTDTFKVVN